MSPHTDFVCLFFKKVHLGDTALRVRSNVCEGLCTVSHFGWYSEKDQVLFFFCFDATADVNLELGVYLANTLPLTYTLLSPKSGILMSVLPTSFPNVVLLNSLSQDYLTPRVWYHTAGVPDTLD